MKTQHSAAAGYCPHGYDECWQGCVYPGRCGRFIPGAELKTGDTIRVWWRPGRDTITALRPYTGPLANLFTSGAQLAEFAIMHCGMTIDNGETYEKV